MFARKGFIKLKKYFIVGRKKKISKHMMIKLENVVQSKVNNLNNANRAKN